MLSLLLGLGGLGAAGGAAVAFLGLGKVLDILAALFRFFSSPLGQVVGVAILMFGAFVAGDIHGQNTEEALWRERQAKTEAAVKERDLQAARSKTEHQQSVIGELESLTDKQKERLARYEEFVDGGCPITAEHLERLR